MGAIVPPLTRRIPSELRN